jgi:hypothetical protein
MSIWMVEVRKPTGIHSHLKSLFSCTNQCTSNTHRCVRKLNCEQHYLGECEMSLFF